MRLILFILDAMILISAGTIIYTAYIAGKNSRKEKKELK